MNIRMQNEQSDDIGLGPVGPMVEQSSATSYNKPGLPKPPAGWGKVIGFTDTVDGDDAGPEQPDERG